MSTLRIGGMGSGMDIGTTIQKILETDTKRIEALQEKQKVKNESVTAWTDVKTTLTAFHKAADTLRWMDVWRKMAPTSSNPGVATATAASNATIASYSIEVSQLARAQSIGSASGLTTSGGSPVTASTKLAEIDGVNVGDQFAIAGQTFTIGANDTISTLRTKINEASANMPADQRVTANVIDNRLVIQRTQTGIGDIVLSDLTGSPLQALGVLDGVGQPANQLLAAQNAIFSVNGAVMERASNSSLTDIVEGVTLHLSDVGTTVVDVRRDTEAVKEAINTFVNTYNEAIEALEFYGKNEDSDPSNPLPGLLQGDSLVREIATNMRRLATQLMGSTHTAANSSYTYNGQEGVMNALHHVGVWTTDKNNRLSVVDEQRLDTVLQQNPEQVENLFRGIQSSSGQRIGGVANTLYSTSRAYVSDLDGYIDLRIEGINDEIERQDARIERMIADMGIKETMLWKQFNAMDEAIGAMNSGLDYMLNSLGLKNKSS